MNWFELTTPAQLDALKAESHQHPVIIFKHSTRCSISRAVLDRVERNWNKEDLSDIKPYFLDLLTHRSISDQIASEFDIEHESPQLILVHQGKPLYAQSHYGIDVNEIKRTLQQATFIKN